MAMRDVVRFVPRFITDRSAEAATARDPCIHALLLTRLGLPASKGNRPLNLQRLPLVYQMQLFQMASVNGISPAF